jgi:hypothetical protein
MTLQIIYYCRHCHSYIGQVDGDRVDDRRLGFHSLTPEEHADIISYNKVENRAYVKTVCDFCQLALEQHPELMLLENPLQ